MIARNGHVRCAIYTRKSTEEGLEQVFNSLDAQRESAEHYIASHAHEGWECLSARYDDGGYSGGNMDRPALGRLLADVETGEIDCIVVYRADRITRSLVDFARIMDTLQTHNVSFVSVTESFDTRQPGGRLHLHMMLSFAQYERELVSERTRHKIAAARRRGQWTGGRPLLGYDVDRSTPGATRLVVNADEAARVRQIFELYLEHGSLIPTVRILNDRGWRTKQWETKTGRVMGDQPFHKGRLFTLLNNPTYIGKVTYKDEQHDGEHKAIVPDDLWRAVQSRLQRNGRTGGAEARNKHGALLRGLLYCGPCGCTMVHSYTTKGNKRYRYYVCSEAQKRGWDRCPSKSVPAGEMEKYVIEQIRCVGRDPGLVAATLEEARRQAEEGIERLAAERSTVERELKRDTAALRKTTDAARLADLHDRIGTCERRFTKIREEIGSLRDGIVGEDEIRSALAQFDDLWAALAPKEQARVLQLLIERVEYDGIEGTVSVTFRPTGVRALEGIQQEAVACA